MKSLKSVILALVSIGSSFAYADCRPGQMTTLTRAVDFVRKSDDGKMLRLSLAPGSAVHVIKIVDDKIEVLAQATFDNQNMSLLSDLDINSQSSLKCSVE